jgi:hypothetical protein
MREVRNSIHVFWFWTKASSLSLLLARVLRRPLQQKSNGMPAVSARRIKNATGYVLGCSLFLI